MTVVNSGVSGPKFTKFLCDVERTSGVLMCPSALPSCHPLCNASPKDGVSLILATFAPKIGCHGNVPWLIAHEYQIGHLQPHVYRPWKFPEDQSCRFWDLFAPIKKERWKIKQVTAVEHKLAGLQPGGLNSHFAIFHYLRSQNSYNSLALYLYDSYVG